MGLGWRGGCMLLWRNAPQRCIDLKFAHGLLTVLFIAGSSGSGLVGWLRRIVIRRRGGRHMSVHWTRRRVSDRLRSSGYRDLADEADMLLINSIGDLGSLAEKIKILANRSFRNAAACVPKGVIIESVVGFVKLIAQAIVGIFKLEGVDIVVMAGEASKGVANLGEPGTDRVRSGSVKSEERHDGTAKERDEAVGKDYW